MSRSISHHNAALLFPSRVLYCFQPQRKGIRLPDSDSESVAPPHSVFVGAGPDGCGVRCTVSVDIETTGFDLGRSGDNANSKTKTGTEGAESGSDQFHWFDLSGEAHCLVNTPSLKSTLITSPVGAVHVGRLSPIRCLAPL